MDKWLVVDKTGRPWEDWSLIMDSLVSNYEKEISGFEEMIQAGLLLSMAKRQIQLRNTRIDYINFVKEQVEFFTQEDEQGFHAGIRNNQEVIKLRYHPKGWDILILSEQTTVPKSFWVSREQVNRIIEERWNENHSGTDGSVG